MAQANLPASELKKRKLVISRNAQDAFYYIVWGQKLLFACKGCRSPSEFRATYARQSKKYEENEQKLETSMRALQQCDQSLNVYPVFLTKRDLMWKLPDGKAEYKKLFVNRDREKITNPDTQIQYVLGEQTMAMRILVEHYMLTRTAKINLARLNSSCASANPPTELECEILKAIGFIDSQLLFFERSHELLAATEGTVGVERTSPSQQLGEQAGEGSGGLHQTSDENPPRTPDDGGELTGEGAFQTPEGGATIEKSGSPTAVFAKDIIQTVLRAANITVDSEAELTRKVFTDTQHLVEKKVEEACNVVEQKVDYWRKRSEVLDHKLTELKETLEVGQLTNVWGWYVASKMVGRPFEKKLRLFELQTVNKKFTRTREFEDVMKGLFGENWQAEVDDFYVADTELHSARNLRAHPVVDLCDRNKFQKSMQAARISAQSQFTLTKWFNRLTPLMEDYVKQQSHREHHVIKELHTVMTKGK